MPGNSVAVTLREGFWTSLPDAVSLGHGTCAHAALFSCSSQRLIVSCLMQKQQAGERATATPIQALPPASALDLDVLDALPLHLKRELERAYGETHSDML